MKKDFRAGRSARKPAIWLMVTLGMLCTLVAVVFARLAYGLVLPAMREGLGLSYSQAANLGTVTALGYLSLVMVAGIFAGRFGGKLAVLLGLCLAVVGFGGMALASHYFLLIFLMVVLGFATAFAYTPLISLLGAWFPERRGMVIGLANGGVGLGMLVAGFLVPWLTGNYPSIGWRLVWGVFAAVAGITALLVLLLMEDPPGSERRLRRETCQSRACVPLSIPTPMW